MFTAFVFAMALSLDSLGVGLSYGLQRMAITPMALAVISLCSGSVLAAAMTVGQWLTTIISPAWVKLLGAGILILLGAFTLIKNTVKLLQNKEGTLFELSISSLGIIIRILRQPKDADLDRSGTINWHEAVFLGLALSLDAFGAGIGAALLGLGILETSVAVGICAFLFLTIGMRLGQTLGSHAGYNKLSLVPGVILIAIGISRLVM